MIIDFLKNILYVFVICIFLYLILGHNIVEGMENGSPNDDAPNGDVPNGDAPSNNAPNDDAPSENTSSSALSELFERVNTQADVIRTFKGLFDPIAPLKIDGSGDERIVMLKNIKLLLNNGIFKNETDLKEYEYIGNKAVNVLVSEVNNLNLENPSSISSINKKENDYMNRTRNIIEEHQKIINLELKRRAK
jgi:hypothetical protein